MPTDDEFELGQEIRDWFSDREQAVPDGLIEAVASRSVSVTQRRPWPWMPRRDDARPRRRLVAVAAIAAVFAVGLGVAAPFLQVRPPTVGPAAAPWTLCSADRAPGPGDRLDGSWVRFGDPTYVREAHGAVWIVGLSSDRPQPGREYLYVVRAERTPDGLPGNVADLYSDHLPLAGPMQLSLGEVDGRPAIKVDLPAQDFGREPWLPVCPPVDAAALFADSAKPGVANGLAVNRVSTQRCEPDGRGEAGDTGTWRGPDWDLAYVRRVSRTWWVLALAADSSGRGIGRDAAILLYGQESDGRIAAEWVDMVSGRAGGGELIDGPNGELTFVDEEGRSDLGTLEPCSFG